MSEVKKKINETGDFENVDDEPLIVDSELKGGETDKFLNI